MRKITNKPLTRKQEAFVKHIVNNPKDSATTAAMQTYGNDKDISRNTARSIATENMAKPAIRTELAKYNNMIENTLINTIEEWGSHERPRQREIAIDSAKYVHDKIHGKATQRSEVQATVVSLNLDLSGNNPDKQDE